jgi:hypothetical protein
MTNFKDTIKMFDEITMGVHDRSDIPNNIKQTLITSVNNLKIEFKNKPIDEDVIDGICHDINELLEELAEKRLFASGIPFICEKAKEITHYINNGIGTIE